MQYSRKIRLVIDDSGNIPGYTEGPLCVSKNVSSRI